MTSISTQPFGKLMPIKFVKRDKYSKQIWLFKCECGKLVEKFLYRVKRGETQSCGCIKKKSFSKKEFLRAIKSSSSHQEAQQKLGYKSHAKAKTLYKQLLDKINPDLSHFNLQSRSRTNPNGNSVEAFYNKYLKNAKERNLQFNLTLKNFTKLVESECYYCGENGNSFEKFCGIDRLDNDIGYTAENSVPCCKKCNFLKMSRNHDEFVNHIRLIAINLKLI